MIDKSPFKLLDAFDKGDHYMFFGRSEETDLLHDMVFQSNVTLVYGQSGTGKTSLIKCGLANRFEPSDWLHVHIRRGENINEELQLTLESYYRKTLHGGSGLWERLIREHQTADSKGGKTERSSPSQISVAGMLTRIYSYYLKPVYLMFDQFEELFILGNEEEQQQFYRTIRTILDSGSFCKVIFVMREEYLARLYDFEKVVPELFEKRLRVEQMSRKRADKVIADTANALQIKLEDETISTHIAEKVTGEGQGLVDLPYLQVFLDKLWHASRSRGDSTTTFDHALLEQISDISNVLKEFLYDQLSHFDHEFGDKDRGAVFLKAFTSKRGTKIPRGSDELAELLPQYTIEEIRKYTAFFQSNRVLRPLENEKNELAHDSIAEHITNYSVRGIPMPGRQQLAFDTIPRFPRFAPLTEDKAGSYFGRDDETRELFDRVVNTPSEVITLLYGPVGVGKTSLVRAGLLPRISHLYDVFFHTVNAPFMHKVSKSSEPGNKDFLTQILEADIDTDKPDLIVFDQFEEFFTRLDESHRIRLFTATGELVRESRQRKFLFVLQEKYFAHLSDIERILPSIFNNRMRVGHIDRHSAHKIVAGMGKLAGWDFEDQALIDEIIDKSSSDGRLNIGALQYYLSRLAQVIS